jgi:hypothetical protein
VEAGWLLIVVSSFLFACVCVCVCVLRFVYVASWLISRAAVPWNGACASSRQCCSCLVCHVRVCSSLVWPRTGNFYFGEGALARCQVLCIYGCIVRIVRYRRCGMVVGNIVKHFQTLGLSAGATLTEVKAAYRRCLCI